MVAFVERWARGVPGARLTRDTSGNLHIELEGAPRGGRPIYFTAHLDHPAFVVERVIGPGSLLLSFRGGVLAPYFEEGRVRVHDARGGSHAGTLKGKQGPVHGVLDAYLLELEGGTDGVSVGDVGVWDLPAPECVDGIVHATACDDLAAAAAAMGAFEVLASQPRQDVRLLFTLAEEIGFVGAIGSCLPGRPATMAMDARVIALENSRSFADSPIGGGPVVRVGDRISVFSPGITALMAGCCERVAQREKERGREWKWQRKLMAGGACEASVFCHAGYEATCLCLPLGNYHNMAELERVQGGTHAGRARIEREYIARSDFEGLVDLLVEVGLDLPPASPLAERFEKLWRERSFVLDAGAGA